MVKGIQSNGSQLISKFQFPTWDGHGVFDDSDLQADRDPFQTFGADLPVALVRHRERQQLGSRAEGGRAAMF
jgi:hypothetical protein